MATPSKGTELVPFNDYSVAKVNATDLMEILQENVGGQITEFDLQRASVPTGGMTAWVLPSLDGDDEIVQHIDGVLVYHREPRAYWKLGIDEGGGNNPPDCSSVDGKVGVGDPGGDCKTCPMAEWGSKNHGESRGQACKQMKLIFLLRPDSLLPMALFLPPTSIKPVRQYLLGLAAEGKHYSSAVTRLSLVKERSADGIEYAQVKLTRLATLDDEQVRSVREYSTGLRGALDTITVTEADVASSESQSEPDPYPTDPI
jgi:hypothetical protein